ncbi:MAG: hypothetical protein V3R99_09310 [Thermoguttaceae bacterium]
MNILKRLWNEQEGLVSPKDLLLVSFVLTALLIAGVTSFSGSGDSQTSGASAGSKAGSELGYTGISSRNAATAGSGFEDMTDAMGIAVFIPPEPGDDDDDDDGDDDDDDGGGDLNDPRTQGYWKNKPDAWPVDSLTLGNETYSKGELIDLLKTSVSGDASLILAHQLIAAKLNLAAGVDGSSITNTIAEADALLSIGGRLPQGVTPNSGNPNRQNMIDAGAVLDAFNNSGH